MDEMKGYNRFPTLKVWVPNEEIKILNKGLKESSDAENQGKTQDNTGLKKRSRDDMEDGGGLAADESLKANDFYGLSNDEEMNKFKKRHLEGLSDAEQQDKTGENMGLKERSKGSPFEYDHFPVKAELTIDEEDILWAKALVARHDDHCHCCYLKASYEAISEAEDADDGREFDWSLHKWPSRESDRVSSDDADDGVSSDEADDADDGVSSDEADDGVSSDEECSLEN